ncbi:molybdenum ABC transporter ATP-binding protein [Fulvimarina endophytica]|uniref:Molybdenum ABC transporter ATP-binding protein n=1 Tax=Fulvimarina endophytica TaxID=2293836 RepID=A0A371X537_9HYPH|nr:molybdenum ABC transporter ATP-binding protein [Fulvimarina endophytica]RFC64341.1 molybdenum ABC transporter ATP-binding protein [Fulvimarina endophytica]
MLEVALSHTFAGFALDAEFTAPGGITVLFGRSGSGKSTIVNALAGLLTPQAGRIRLDDRVLLDTARGIDLPPHRRRLGAIFQDSRLFPHLTVSQNLAYGAFFAPKDAARESRDKVVEMLGIGHLLKRRPSALSGGEKQRVAIGRALLAAPRLILADEPLASLDEERKAEILPYFERLRDEVSVPILYVSHSASEVARLATTIVVVKDGRIVRKGRAEEVLSDPAVLPAGVREAGAILGARVLRHAEDGLTEVDAGGTVLFIERIDRPVGAPLRMRIHASDVILTREAPSGLSSLNMLHGTIEEVRAGEGADAMVALSTGGGRLLARLTRRSVASLDLAPGVAVYAIVKSVSVAPGDIAPGATEEP